MPNEQQQHVPTLDTSVPHTARIWNYILGGKDNFEVDREVGEQVLAAQPELAANARHGRAFLQRVVRYLAGEAGVRQFLDIGTGLPAPNNTHEVAQGIDPTARVVYVDNDPLVLVHARALLRGTPQGRTASRSWRPPTPGPSAGRTGCGCGPGRRSNASSTASTWCRPVSAPSPTGGRPTRRHPVPPRPRCAPWAASRFCRGDGGVSTVDRPAPHERCAARAVALASAVNSATSARS